MLDRYTHTCIYTYVRIPHICMSVFSSSIFYAKSSVSSVLRKTQFKAQNTLLLIWTVVNSKIISINIQIRQGAEEKVHKQAIHQKWYARDNKKCATSVSKKCKLNQKEIQFLLSKWLRLLFYGNILFWEGCGKTDTADD